MSKLSAAFIAAAALVSLHTAAVAQAPAWPSHTVKIVVSTPAGSGQDLIARTIAEPLQKRFGQPFIVDNVPGAGSVASAAAVVKAPADGYTILVANIAPIGIVPVLRPDMPYDAAKDLVPIGQITNSYFMVMVNPQKLAVNSLAELIKLLKDNPGKYSYASSGPGGVVHLQTELFMQRTGTKLVHVPYKSVAEAMTALLGGHVDMTIGTIAEPGLGYFKSGALKVLAVTSDGPRPELPGVPTAVSSIPGYAYGSVWQGLFARAGTPPDIIAKLNAALMDYLKSPDGAAEVTKLGYDPSPKSTEDFGKLVRSEVTTWSEIIKTNNIKLE